APPETKSFIVICEDPDAPGDRFYHWGLYNIPLQRTELEAEFRARGQDGIEEARNDAGGIGYHGPCPPPGEREHRYHFLVWALNVEHLDFPTAPTVEELKRRAEEHVIDRAEVQAWYGR
ncbi:MAG: YbhB/YbcL family Raf kinase inhibitor-like protein, partial [Bradymonadaceae bacterium]